MHDEHNTERSKDAAPNHEAAPPAAAAPHHEAVQPAAAAVPSEAASQPKGGQPADGGDADPPVENEVDRLRRERDECYERLIRTTADFDNYRKRTDRERRELTEHAAMDLLTDLLPLVDDFERALAADAKDGDAYRRGVEIIHKQLLDLMVKRGVSPIDALGTNFDPTLHQAVVHEPSASHRDGEIMEELRRGYTLRDRLLRASMVKVAKA